MSGVSITASIVRAALRGLIFPSERPDDLSLLRLELVRQRLRGRQLPIDAAAKWGALENVLHDLVCEMRHSETGLCQLSPDPSELTRLKNRVRRESWESVSLWCFAEPQLIHRAIAKELKISKSTAERRCESAYTLIAECLDAREKEAVRHLEADRTWSDRPQIGEEQTPQYGMQGNQEQVRAQAAISAILNAVLRGESAPTLTDSELKAIAGYRPASIDEYLSSRVAAWQERGPFHQHFVSLTVWLDMGSEPGLAPAVETEYQFDSLERALEELDDAIVVVVGEPGSGKTTLLEHLEHEVAREALRGTCVVMPFLVRLSDLFSKWDSEEDFLTLLGYEWAARYKQLGSLEVFLTEGRVLLLLDGLNELPHVDLNAYTAFVHRWRTAAHAALAINNANRLIFSCRTLNYTTPLSSPAYRVPRLQIRPLTDASLRRYLDAHATDDIVDLWSQIEVANLLDVLRVPFFLQLFVRTVRKQGQFPDSRAGVLADFIRSSLRREIANGNRLFDADRLIARRDYVRLMRARRWVLEWELPERGKLVPAFDKLAIESYRAATQDVAHLGDLSFDQALLIMNEKDGEDILEAGMALGILNDRAGRDAVEFIHMQMQEFFVARALARVPQPDLVSCEWRATDIAPPLIVQMDELHPAEPLPPLGQSGWEEPTVLAVEMSNAPDDYISSLSSVNLALAGRCAATPAIRQRLSDDEVDTLRHSLLNRSRDNGADLRDRIACGYALGDLGDSRFQLCSGPLGPYLKPPTVLIPGGNYPIGDDMPLATAVSTPTAHCPQHTVRVASISIGMFTITNGEWQWFMKSLGYDSEQWWDTQASKDWRAGLITGATMRQDDMDVAAYFRASRDALDAQHANGTLETKRYEFWLDRIGLTGAAEAEWLQVKYPDKLIREPSHWKDGSYNRPTQPVVGVSWFEARAYCAWLSEQTGKHYRLPTEVEWEAAARGKLGSRFPYGADPDLIRANTSETHLRRPSPVGVFPLGNTPTGICDMAGNVGEWTSSAWGMSDKAPDFPYPYVVGDGREDADTPFGLRRITRGGSTFNDIACAQSFIRGITLPGLRVQVLGFRVVLDESSTPPRSKR